MGERRSVLLLCDEHPSHAANVRQHVDALKRHSRHFVYPFNPIDRADACRLLELDEFDVVVVHYTIALISERYLPSPLRERLAAFRGLKIEFIQDEYRAVDAVTDAMRSLGIDVLFTCAPEPAASQIYGERVPGATTITTLPGYVPDELVGRSVPPIAERAIDVGYRGRDVPVWLGRLGREKTEIGRGFLERAPEYGLRCDISSREEDRIYGEAWNRLLASCRTTLGTESGASIVDFDGTLEAAGKDYVARHPNAGAMEIERDLTGRLEGNVVIATASPRLFEAAALRTPMILFRGGYSGVVEPDVHYIPLEKDFSNLDEVVELVRDVPFLQGLADRTYDDLIASGRYTLRALVEQLDTVIDERGGRHGRAAKQAYRRAHLRRRVPSLVGPSRLRVAAGRLLAPPAAAALATADAPLRALVAAGLRCAGDLRRLTALRRGVAGGSFHVVTELVPEEKLLFLSSRPGRGGPFVRDLSAAVSRAFETGKVERIVWNHSRVSVAAGLVGSLLATPVGHYGVDGAYSFQALPELAARRPQLVLDALAPLLVEPAAEPAPTVVVEG